MYDGHRSSIHHVDAYQHQIELEREKREKAEKETAELKGDVVIFIITR